MKQLLRILSVLTFLIGIANSSSAQKFFEVEEVKDAQVRFFLVDDPKDADLFFCIIYDEKEITKPGILMEVETPKEAQVTLIFVDDVKDANIKVWMVDTPAEVKWINESKRKLLAVGGLR